MKKRTLALMLSAALCVGLLAGCGSGNNDPVQYSRRRRQRDPARRNPPQP